MSNFQYRPRSSEAWDKRAKGSIYDGYAKDEFETFSAGKENYIRILPPTWENAQHYGLDLYVHYGVGPNNGTIICLYKMKNLKCPICEAFARAEAAGREDANTLKPTRRVLVWVLNRKEEKKPLLWAMPWTVDRDISKICRDRQSGELYYIDDPQNGYDITFDKEGEGMTTKYTGFQLSRRPSAVEQKYIDFVVEHPVPSVLLWRTYEEVQALFEGAAPEVTSETETSTEDRHYPPQAVSPHPDQMQIPASPAPVQVAPPPKPFVSEWTGANCAQCGKPTYTISPNEATCELGHRFFVSTAPSVAPPAPPPMVAASVVPAQTVDHANGGAQTAAAPQAPAPSTSRAAAMRERFQTGKR